MHPHLQQLHAALLDEQRFQEAEHRSLLALAPDEQVAAGLRWPPVQVEALEPARSGSLLVVRAPRGAGLHDGIGPGELVRIEKGERRVEGRIEDVEAHRAWIRLQDRDQALDDLDWLHAGPIEIIRVFDPSTFIRYRVALERADAAKGRLKDVLLGEARAAPPESEPVDWLELNPAQQRAAGVALAADPVALVHGPPGTGKTFLVARLLRHLVKVEGERPWALADSNAATDNLALSAERVGLKVVRLGRRERIGPLARHLSLEAGIEASPLREPLRALDRELDRALMQLVGAERRRVLGELFGERRRMLDQARQHVLESAEVLACTLGTLARIGPELPPARTAILDEATQAIEPGAWGAVPHVERLVLVGDPHQLGPVVLEAGNPLSRSLFDRMLDEAGLAAPMLSTQHRMHEEIQALVSSVYGSAYHPHPQVQRHLLEQLPGVGPGSLTGVPVLFVDTAGAGLEEQRDPVSLSLYNPGEIRLVVLAITRLRQAGVAASDIGVIAPYSAQVNRLRDQPEMLGVEVATVNAFQGREKEVIVCSFVRSNDRGELGFVADRRRLTVALTRARRLLLCTGDGSTLGSSTLFADLLQQLEQAGALSSAWEEPWAQALDPA